jgi:hypothetical protein
VKIIQCSHHSELLIGTDAFATQYAFAQISLNKRIQILELHIEGHLVVVDITDP